MSFPLCDRMIISMNSKSLSHILMRTCWLNKKKEATDQSWTEVLKELHYENIHIPSTESGCEFFLSLLGWTMTVS